MVDLYLSFFFTFSTQSRFYFVLVRPANYAGLVIQLGGIKRLVITRVYKDFT